MVNEYKCRLSQTCVAPALLSHSITTFLHHILDIVYLANYIPIVNF